MIVILVRGLAIAFVLGFAYRWVGGPAPNLVSIALYFAGMLASAAIEDRRIKGEPTDRRVIGRVPMVRRDQDGTTVDGMAMILERDDGSRFVTDFRDLDGVELALPPGSRFEIKIATDEGER